MEQQQQEQQNVEVAEECGIADVAFEVRTEAMRSEEKGGEEASISGTGPQTEDGVSSRRIGGLNPELKRESSDAAPQGEENEGGRNEELKRENRKSSPRAEWRKERVSPTEGLRTGGSKGKGSKGSGRGGKTVDRESGRNSWESSRKDKSSETIRAAGLPSMRRMKSQPGRNRGGGEREEVLEKKKEPVQEKGEDVSNGEVAVNWAAWVKQWVEKQEPTMLAVRDFLLELCVRVKFRVKQHWPVVRALLSLALRVMLMLSLLGFEAAIRGFASLFRLGSATHFLLLWCSILSFIRLSGVLNLILVLGLGAGAIFFVGYIPAFLLLGLFGTTVLWLYGSFWLTGAVIIAGGTLLAVNQSRLAVLTTTSYAVYTMKGYGGWLGLLLSLALAFISSDLAHYFLSSVEKEEKFTHTKAEHVPPSQQKSFNGRSADGSVPHTDSYQGNVDSARSSAGASTSGVNEGDPSSAEEEVIRVLGCNDHYAVLGFARYEKFDVSNLKREYRKKAMLVHPDKNGGNDLAEEAFKRLQNAYEVLLDAIKKRTYDEELRHEDILMSIRKQHVHRNGRNGTPDCGCRHSEDDGEDDMPTNSRRISCRKCGNNHAWISTNKTKLRARWCQECQDHHPAKDGDGWVEQTGQALFLGIFRKVDIPHAYACADGVVYEVTEWVLCQGLKCQPNTHKPSFQVNTSGIGKSSTRPSRSAKGPSMAPDGFPYPEGFPFPPDGNMTEREFFEWLRSTMGSPAKPGSATKPRGKKKKGKKTW